MKFSKHEHNSQLSYPDHIHCNLQVSVHYMKLIATLYDTLCEKSLLICVISNKNPVVHPNISNIYTFSP